MKNLFFFEAARWGRFYFALAVAVSMLLLASPTHAQNRQVWAGVVKNSDLSYLVWACNPAARPGAIRVVNNRGQVCFEEYSSAISFGRRLDFAELPDGKYAIMVKIGRDMHRFDVTMQSSARRWAEVKETGAASQSVSMEVAPIPTLTPR